MTLGLRVFKTGKGLLGILTGAEGLCFVWRQAEDKMAAQAHELNESIVAIYLHERVPEIAFDDTAPHRLFKTHQKLAFERGGAHVVRYLVPCSLLSKWTAEQLAELSGMGRRGVRAQSTRSNRLAWRMARETERLTCSASSPSSVSAAACNH